MKQYSIDYKGWYKDIRWKMFHEYLKVGFKNG